MFEQRVSRDKNVLSESDPRGLLISPTLNTPRLRCNYLGLPTDLQPIHGPYVRAPCCPRDFVFALTFLREEPWKKIHLRLHLVDRGQRHFFILEVSAVGK